MEPDIGHPPRAEGAAGLRDLVFVVGKDEVDPAAVNVEHIAVRVVAFEAAAERLEQRRHRHRRALDMPAGTPRRSDASRARPAWLVRLRGLPQHEIHRVAFVRRDVDPCAGQHLVERTVGERPVARRAGKPIHRRGREQHVILGDIGDAAGDEPLDHRSHFPDILRGARLVGRRQAAKGCNVLVELALGRLRHFGDRLVQRKVGIVALGARIDLVVDVGDVADVDDVVRPVDVPQQAEQDVEHDDRPGVADMGEVVDGRTADVDPDRARIDRREILFPAGQGVVKTKRRAPFRRLPGRSRGVRTAGWTGRGHRETLQPSSRDLRAQSRAARDWPDDRFSKGFENKETRTSQLEASG